MNVEFSRLELVLVLVWLAVAGCVLWGVYTILRSVFGVSKLRTILQGENKLYSLSRLQLVAWVHVIISYQLVVLMLLLMKGADQFSAMQIQFAEPILWLLLLSLSTYITVKGISSNKPRDLQSSAVTAGKLTQLLEGPNGIDFSRLQMMVWTLIGLTVFIFHCCFYIGSIRGEDDPRILSSYFKTESELKDYTRMVDSTIAFKRKVLADTAATATEKEKAKKESSEWKRVKDNLPLQEALPSISWTFLILMGLSQGAYAGRKLLPDYSAKTETSVPTRSRPEKESAPL
jgi:hypothetical protein